MRFLAALSLYFALLLGSAWGQTVTTANVPLVYPLGQSNVPLILVSSGSIGNNGALTAITATNTTYANCFMWFPTGAISAGSVANWYFVQMASTTAGTIFNNTYTSGTPAVPASPTAFVTTGPGAYVQTTATDIPAYQITIPAGLIQLTDRFRLTGFYSMTNSAGNKLFKVKLGAVTLRNPTVTTQAGYSDLLVIAPIIKTAVAVQPAMTASPFGQASNANGAIAVTDISTSQVLSVTLQIAAAADNLSLDQILAERIVGVP